MVSPEWAAMHKLVSQIYARHDAEPFREAVDWKALGLFDYPQIIKKPMDLSQVKKNIDSQKVYNTIHDAADDIRLIWKNCMQYNADESDFYVLAQNFSKRFEEKFKKLCAEHGTTSSSKSESKSKYGSNAAHHEPTLDEKRTFAKSLYKITKEQLGKVICDLDEKCKDCLTKSLPEDEVEINVDRITPFVFEEVMAYVNQCIGDNTASDNNKSGMSGRKKKIANSSSVSMKKAKNN